MYHKLVFVDITEWLKADVRKPLDAQAHLLDVLKKDHGGKVFDEQFAKLVNEFLEADVSISDLTKGKKTSQRVADLYIRLIRIETKNLLIFIDIERRQETDSNYVVEVDIFSEDVFSIADAPDWIAEVILRSFGITAAKEDALVSTNRSQDRVWVDLSKAISPRGSLSSELFSRLKNPRDREILRELKKRGSIVESDLNDIVPSASTVDEVKSVLDYFSATDRHLVDRKFAIICRQSGEILFRLAHPDDVKVASSLECPKCGKKLGDENISAHYAVTDALRELIDNSRWMPLLVRDAFIAHGVADDQVFAEVMNSKDEIDNLVFHRNSIFVIECKNRQISLNDAYKLSAKASRLEKTAFNRALPTGIVGPEDDEGEMRFAYTMSSRARARYSFTPVLISTSEIANDAKDLLRETRPESIFIENADIGLDEKIGRIIGDLNRKALKRRVKSLVHVDDSDSISRAFVQLLERATEKFAADA